MNPSSISPSSNTPNNVSDFKFIDNQGVKDVHPTKIDIADKIDLNKNKVLEDNEIKDYMRKKDILRDPEKCSVDEEKLVKEFKDYLQNQPLAQAKGYHSYEETVNSLKSLESKKPDICKMVSLGKSHEGRDIWALKISKGAQSDTSSKPGIVFTGLTHAREWITMEAALYLANGLVNNYDSDEKTKARVNNAEIWVVPVTNPDGYEYSRTDDSWWRKNRRPITDKGCETNFEGNLSSVGANDANSRKILGEGVDLNRNYYDGNPEHFELYRPAGDKPDSTYDDFSATSDDPQDDTYRGPEGASENEVKSLLALELGKKNIKGVIDFHAYGEMILYPWSTKYDSVENVETYKTLGKKMNEAMGNSYRLMPSVSLYPASGASEDIHHANKKISFTIEMARSFQPYEKDIEPTCKKLYPACNAFVDWIVENKDNIPWPDNPPKS